MRPFVVAVAALILVVVVVVHPAAAQNPNDSVWWNWALADAYAGETIETAQWAVAVPRRQPRDDAGRRRDRGGDWDRLEALAPLPDSELVVRYRRATALFSVASAHASTRRARNAKDRFTRACFVSRINACRSSSVRTKAFLGRPVIGMPL